MPFCKFIEFHYHDYSPILEYFHHPKKYLPIPICSHYSAHPSRDGTDVYDNTIGSVLSIVGVNSHKGRCLNKEGTVAQRGEITEPGSLRGSRFKPRTLLAQTKEKVLRKCVCKDVGDVTLFKLRRNALYKQRY